jgi:uncharacterized protein (DUF58 family)
VKLIKSFYLSSLFFLLVIAIIFLFVISYYIPPLLILTKLILITLIVFLVFDILILYANRIGVYAYRESPNRLSNGDENEIKIFVTNNYSFRIRTIIIDELPFDLQIRNNSFSLEIKQGITKIISYFLRPVKRGEYNFGNINVYVSSRIGLVRRRYRFEGDKIIPVYPSYVQMRKYELMAISDRLTEAGIKKVRRVGHSMEFEQIKEYVKGDDYRTINWKATARKNHLMVNHFEDEKSQQVYSVIDTGRIMKMPFEGMSLLDYAINASLVISNIVVYKQDKAGLITFSNKVNNILPADRQAIQMNKILEILYRQKTDYPESDFEILVSNIFKRISHRSLILLFTNFETLSSLERQIQFIRKLAQRHLLVLIFFINTQLNELINQAAGNVEQIYHKTIAEKFAFEKRLIVKELARYSIHSILTTPQNLSVSTINKYLELKARHLI